MPHKLRADRLKYKREYQRVYRAERLEHIKAIEERSAKKNRVNKAIRSLTFSCERRYGITYAFYLETLTAQAHRCASCRGRFESSKHTHIDHDHKTGRFRAILCRRCNLAAGLLQDSPRRARQLAAYLEKYKRRRARTKKS